ncbi:MAG: UDP-2,4-diacetamido-2,4,6-trideoxy-beta-L-altropyranose hydrolase [Gammaproteobacteria bacterium]|nr:UDP-2,4-diacetamido-2,4,6-trideoxy-beta-L-altropyranose hydrolase [Gammaproteobacteria bacterium]
MRLFIRADASTTLGSGHVKRCFAIAERSNLAPADVCFLCLPHDGHLGDDIQARRFQLRWLADNDADSLNAEITPDATLLIDHYAIDERIESQLHANKIVVLDGQATQRHHCNTLVDPSGESDRQRHARSLKATTQLCVGPRYIPLATRFLDAQSRPLRQRLTAVLICFGGTDPSNLTQRIAATLCKHLDLSVTLIAGPQNAHLASLQQFVATAPNCRLDIAPTDLKPHYLAADLAIGAGGVMSWERIAMALPSIVLPIADNQRRQTRALSQQQLIWSCDDLENLEALLNLIKDDPQQLTAQSARCKAIADTIGVPNPWPELIRD